MTDFDFSEQAQVLDLDENGRVKKMKRKDKTKRECFPDKKEVASSNLTRSTISVRSLVG